MKQWLTLTSRYVTAVLVAGYGIVAWPRICTADPLKLRVLVAYTDSAAAANGDILAHIDALEDSVQTAYERSDVAGAGPNPGLCIEVVCKVRLPTSLDPSSTTCNVILDAFVDPDDGHMDAIHELRDLVGADFCVLLAQDTGTTCTGIADTPCPEDTSDSTDLELPFVVSDEGNYHTFAHELGHLHGHPSGHSWCSANSSDETQCSSCGSFSNPCPSFMGDTAQGWFHNGHSGHPKSFGTLMQIASGKRLIFSNPQAVWVEDISGTPTEFNVGCIEPSDSTETNMAKQINLSGPTVTAYRAEYDTLVLDSGTYVDTDVEYRGSVPIEASFITDTGESVTLTSGDRIQLLAGFEAREGSADTFRIEANLATRCATAGKPSMHVGSRPRAPGEAMQTNVTRTHLIGNAPNPFNPSTRIAFDLSKKSDVELRIYDVSGRIVRTFLATRLEPGRHSILWNGKSQVGLPVASGIYLYELSAQNYRETRKMVLLR